MDDKNKTDITESDSINIEDVSKKERPIKKRINLNELFKNAVNAIYTTFLRFPTTIILFLTLAVMLIYQIEKGDLGQEWLRLNFICVLGIPFSICISLFIENFKKNAGLAFKTVLYAGELIILALYLNFFLKNLDDMVTIVRLLIITFSLAIVFLLIPFLKRKTEFEVYITNLLSRAVITGFYSGILGGGLSIIIFAIKALLVSDLSNNFIPYMWIFTWLVFLPFYFLYGYPKSGDDFPVEHYNKVLKVLLLYIVQPLVSAFTLVLYAYFAKIIFTQVWPNGIVSYLVVSYAAVGVTVVFLIAPLTVLNRWAKIFTSVLIKAIFPLLAMMFVSIFIRIGDYGVTENRYFILVIGIWTTIVMIYINFDKGKRNIFLPISLAVVLFLSVVGPWNAFNVSRISQSNRLESILTRYGMIDKGEIVKSKSVVSATDKVEITGVLNYFNGPHKFSEIKYLPTGFDMSKMDSVFGFSENYPDMSAPETGFGYYSPGMSAFEISGYDIIFKFNAFSNNNNGNVIFDQSINSKLGTLKLMINGNKIAILRDSKELISYDLNEYVKNLYGKYGNFSKGGTVTNKDFTVTDSNANAQIMMVFENINGNMNSSGTQAQINSFNGIVFVKIK